MAAETGKCQPHYTFIMTIYPSAQRFVVAKRKVYVPSMELPWIVMLGTPPSSLETDFLSQAYDLGIQSCGMEDAHFHFPCRCGLPVVRHPAPAADCIPHYSTAFPEQPHPGVPFLPILCQPGFLCCRGETDPDAREVPADHTHQPFQELLPDTVRADQKLLLLAPQLQGQWLLQPQHRQLLREGPLLRPLLRPQQKQIQPRECIPQLFPQGKVRRREKSAFRTFTRKVFWKVLQVSPVSAEHSSVPWLQEEPEWPSCAQDHPRDASAPRGCLQSRRRGEQGERRRLD